MSEQKTMTFEEQIKRLEAIVAALEKGDVQLADSLALFEEGTKLIAACSRELDQAEQRVVQLLRNCPLMCWRTEPWILLRRWRRPERWRRPV